MSTHLLLEAAVRTLVMGAIIFLALHVLRIEQIRARRTAWLLALAGALAMPFLVAAHIGPPLLPEFSANRPVIVQSTSLTAAPMPAKTPAHDHQMSGSVQVPPAGVPNSYWVDRGASAEIVDAHLNVGGPIDHSGTWLTLAIIGYFAVAAVLALRLCAGVGFALRLRNQAKRVILPFDPDLDTRSSLRLKTPVTIGSSVLLPRNFTLWDSPTLRIVLTHERAHVRQGDFYVHLLARLHCALFWFSPFSWWLLRQLSDLGEALSDCAAVEQAESRASYAETLLAFATQDHSPLAGVAMARSSNLSPRIERLLSDQRFERSFAPKQRLPIIAGGVVVIAMLAATATVRVNAAPNFSVVTDTHSASTADTTLGTSDTTPPAVPSPPATPNPPAPIPRAPKIKHVKVLKEPAEADAGDIDVSGSIDEEEADRVVRESAAEEVLAIRSGESHIMINSGGSLDIHAPSSGDYIYFKHNGKPYLIQDAAILAKAQAMLAPTKELREKQRELGRQQRALGQQQRALAAQERALAHDSAIKMVESAEFKRDMEDLRRQLKEIDLPQVTAQIDERALAEVQSHLAEIQSRVGRMQFQIGYKGEAFKDMGKFGEQMGKLGTEEGKLGEEQYKLGEQQRKIVEDATRQLKPIIEQAIRDGKAKVVSAE